MRTRECYSDLLVAFVWISTQVHYTCAVSLATRSSEMTRKAKRLVIAGSLVVAAAVYFFFGYSRRFDLQTEVSFDPWLSIDKVSAKLIGLPDNKMTQRGFGMLQWRCHIKNRD